MVAGLEMGQQGGVDRGHAGCGGAAGLGSFEEGEAVLQHLDRGVAEATVLVVRDRALEGGLSLGGIVVDEAGSQEESLAGLAERGALDAAVHEDGVWTVGWFGHDNFPENGRSGCRRQCGSRAGAGLFSALV